jgi:predicted dehydrogenase
MNNKTSIIIGGGAIGCNFHAPRLLHFYPQNNLVIFEVDPTRRTFLEKQFVNEKKVRITGDLPEDQQYEIAVIATPPKFHFDYYNKLEGRAKKILIEKPLTITAEQAVSLHESATQKDQQVFVAMIRRSLMSYQLVKDFYNSRKFGELQSVKIYEGGVFNWKAVSMGSFSSDLNGGGVLMDTGPHTIDLLFQVFDKLEVNSSWMDGFAPAIEANCTIDMTADDKIPVTLVLSRNRNLSNSAVFQFTNATLTVSVIKEIISVEPQQVRNYVIYPEGFDVQIGTSFTQLIDSLYTLFLIPGNNKGVSPAESIKTLQLINKAYKIAQPMQGGF